MMMKLNMNVPIEVVADAIRCVLAVRYGEDDMPYKYPHRSGDIWDITIDIITGQIRDWPAGTSPRQLMMKVCDEGSYYLMSGDRVLAQRESDYVPPCVPGSYGDYVDFDIDANGLITNWECDVAEVTESFNLDGKGD